MLDEAGVNIAINLPVMTRPSQFDSILHFSKELSEREYQRAKIISFAGIHPDTEDVEERLSLIKKEGFLGIKIHPDYQNTFFDDEKYVRILGCAKNLDLITVTHAGVDGAYIGQPVKCTPTRVLRLLDKIGGYDKLVLAHIGGNEFEDEVYEILAGEQVYFDTAYSLHSMHEDMFKKMLSKHGEDRVLFATDSPWRNIREEVGIIKKFNLGAITEEKIFSLNAKKLLNL